MSAAVPVSSCSEWIEAGYAKKLARRIGGLAVCALCAATVYAQEITLDDAWDVVTRESPADAPVFAAFACLCLAAWLLFTVYGK